jgi:hypothetical protein
MGLPGPPNFNPCVRVFGTAPTSAPEPRAAQELRRSPEGVCRRANGTRPANASRMMFFAIRPPSSAARVLSYVSGACAATASVTTLLWSGSFPLPPGNSAFNAALAEARGWSLVTLTIALPLLGLCLRAARNGSRSGHLSWLGVLAYLVYTYLELAVSPPFTALYLLYVLAFACAIPAWVLGVAAVDAAALERSIDGSLPRRSIAAFGLASGMLLSLAWLKGIVAQTVAGQFGWPSGVDAVGHVVHALDLGLQAPLGIATGLLLLRGKPGGALLAPILLVNSICMGLALTAMVVSSALAGGRSPLEGAPFTVIPIVAAALATLFFRAVRRSTALPRTAPDEAATAGVLVARGLH